jgi:hypothetical protein
MTQLIFGAALGFILGEGVLYGLKHSIGWLQGAAVRKHVGSLFAVRGSDLIRGFIKYAGVSGAAVALITLAVWSVGDYLAAKSARRVTSANVAGVGAAASIPGPAPHGAPNEGATGMTPPSKANSGAAMPVVNVDPYDDSDFKIQRRPRTGPHSSLRETLVQRSEARARMDLLKQTQEHAQRSQYDCETAERASKYLKAGLDVWGFATWQLRYFPRDGFKGATLPQCKGIKDVTDASGLQS